MSYYKTAKGGILKVEFFPIRVEISVQAKFNSAQIANLTTQDVVEIEQKLRLYVKTYCSKTIEVNRFLLTDGGGKIFRTVVLLSRIYYSDASNVSTSSIEKDLITSIKMVKDEVCKRSGINISRSTSASRERVRALKLTIKELSREGKRKNGSIELSRSRKGHRPDSGASNSGKGKKSD
jgi:hypothetical protein